MLVPASVAARTGRHPQTVMGWVHAYNARGPDALGFRRTGGRPPLCAKIAAALRDAVCAAQRTAATPPLEGADPAPRWTLQAVASDKMVGIGFGLRWPSVMRPGV